MQQKITELSQLPKAMKKKKTLKRFTTAELAQIRHYGEKGMHPKEVAIKLDRKYSSVHNKMKSLKLLKMGGGKTKDYLEALRITQETLAALGLKLTIAKIN